MSCTASMYSTVYTYFAFSIFVCVSDVQLFYFAGYIFLSSVLLLHGKYRQHCPGHHQPEDIPQVRSQLRRTCEEVDCEMF